MGSLAAVLSRRQPPTVAMLERALTASPHRGPVRGTVIRGACAVGITHTDALPESSLADESDLAVAFTGTLDNLGDLAADRERIGATPGSSDPAAVVASVFRAEGERTFARLRGAFAVAVTDGVRLWCARDHVGYRPLSYRDDAHELFVASEAKQVVAGTGIAREPDLDVLQRIFYGNYSDETPSAFLGVSRVPKSTAIRGEADATALARFWHPERLLETGRYAADELQGRFDEVFGRATDRMLTGEDGVSLSGGIDSPAIAAYAAPAFARRFGRPMVALTAVYPDHPSVDESAWVQIVVERLGMELHTYRRDAPQLDRLREWTERFDGPVPVFPPADAERHYTVARELGLRMVMNGAVAELVFDMRGHLLAHLLRRGRLRAVALHASMQRDKGVGPGGLARQLGSAFVPGSLYAAHLRRRPRRRGERVPPWVDLAKVNERAIGSSGPAAGRWREGQIGGLVGPGLSAEANEVVQEVCGVRARYPWADVDVWEFFLSLPAQVKFPDAQTKGLVRRLLRGRVPDPILDRKEKTVFNEAAESAIEFEHLRTWLTGVSYRMPGVDYGMLAEHLERADMNVFEYIWAKDLAAVHAFLDLWDRA
jgi:asparagine synthase (glutamine-hydrolysing)